MHFAVLERDSLPRPPEHFSLYPNHENCRQRHLVLSGCGDRYALAGDGVFLGLVTEDFEKAMEAFDSRARIVCGPHWQVVVGTTLVTELGTRTISDELGGVSVDSGQDV